MHKELVLSNMGKILILLGALMIAPLTVSLIYHEGASLYISFLIPIALMLAIGLFLGSKFQERATLSTRDGFFIVSFTWIFASIFGALPFYISGHVPNPIDAIFEAASGFTTTGATIITNVESLPHSLLFWRSFTHFIGGMGILVFVLAIFSNTQQGTVNIMRAEVPGPVFGKLVSKVRVTAQILYKMYIAMTAVVILLLMISGMSLFDAMIHGFGIAGTGGFSNYSQSIGYFNNAAIEIITIFGMIAFGINFNLYYLFFLKRSLSVFQDEELRLYIGVIFTAIVLICINVYPMYESVGTMVRDVSFTVASIISTTGYSTVDFGSWPLFAHLILLCIMFTGSMAGSTAGGFKMGRILRIVKSSIREVKIAVSPRRIVPIRENDVTIEQNNLKSTYTYFILYFMILVFLILIVALDDHSMATTVSAVMATFNNIGPGLDIVGPAGSFYELSNLSKIALTFSMLIGRLEILPIIVLFNKRFWSKR